MSSQAPAPPSAPQTPPARPPAKGRRFGGLLLDLVIVVAIFIGVHWYKARPLASGEAPALRGPLVTSALTAAQLAEAFGPDGEASADAPAFDLAEQRGQPVLVHFWATWCPVCKLGEGGIDELARDHRVITVAMQSGAPAEVAAYLRERGLGFDAIADPYGEIAGAWGVHGVPTSFIVDADGHIAFSGVGAVTGLLLRAELWLAGLGE